MAYGIAPLDRCAWDDVIGRSGEIDGWCWAGHDGLMASDHGPVDLVPTGWLWGWGAGRWLRWRIDPVAGCVGAELRRGAPTNGFEVAQVRLGRPDEAVSFRREQHMLVWSPSVRRAAGLAALQVIAPAPITFLSMSWDEQA